MEPFLTFSDAPRPAREGASASSSSRGDGGAHDNNPLITEILKLRAEKAKLLGYPTFAHWIADGQMAKTPDAAMELLHRGLGPGRRPGRARRWPRWQALAAAEGSNEPIEPWDYRYYGEKVRKAKYDLDENEVKPYLQLAEAAARAMFWAAGRAVRPRRSRRSTTCRSITPTSASSR